MSDGTPLAERLQRVDDAIAEAARDAGRSPEEITRIVVTKFHPAALVRSLAALGVADVAENRAQEAAGKAAELADLPLTWHFVGQLQTNKARQVASFAAAVHSVDRAGLVAALARSAAARPQPIDCFLQLNLTDDPARGGAAPDAVEPLAEAILAESSLRLLGVMAVAPIGEEPRRAFTRVRAASERLRRLESRASAISAGMSGDFREAVLEGATHLRIGTAITGNRPAGA